MAERLLIPRAAFIAVILAACIAVVSAQEEGTPAVAAPAAPGTRPGMWRVGPFYLTPKFRIGSVGLDTNVLYTPIERTTDISASGGPGLELVLPLGSSGRIYTDGFLNYLYFVKTKAQRRLTGSARGGFAFNTPRTSFILEESWLDSFDRPSFEVNQRVRQSIEGTRLDIKRRMFGRISLLGLASRAHYEAQSETEYLGNDLESTLTRNEYRAGGGLDYALSVKTSFVVEDEQSWYRYPLDQSRDSTSNRIWAGFRTDSTALLAGQAMVGRRFYEFQNAPVKGSATVANVDALFSISPKTKFGGSYGRDIAYSQLPTVGSNPLLTTDTYGARIEKVLATDVDLRIFGTVTQIKSENPVSVVVPDEGLVFRLRDDTSRVVGIDLGYRFRPRLRIGVTAAYGDQTTTIDYFGVEGLIVGATVRFNP